jgi:uncharacterized repeat protein (TIGR03803 family)
MGMAPAPAQAANEIVLRNFASWPNGDNLVAGVIRDSAGNLYGTTYGGGAANAGVVFKVDTIVQVNTESSAFDRPTLGNEYRCILVAKFAPSSFAFVPAYRIPFA